jgi:DNA-directed RNA polymerase subunit RPC12/RpoP
MIRKKAAAAAFFDANKLRRGAFIDNKNSRVYNSENNTGKNAYKEDICMQVIYCQGCGSTSFVEKEGYRVCQYCGAKALIQERVPVQSYTTVVYKNVPSCPVSSSIDLTDDVTRLLMKCKSDPRNARKYANLILDIDSDNTEAMKYLK